MDAVGRRQSPWTVAALAALTLSAACVDPTPPRPANAVIILLDTLRPDRLGCYGNTRDVSPNIDALAARGTRFEQVISPAPWTLPATGALLSGLPPEQAFDRNNKLQSSVIEDLAAAGFVTAAFTEAAFVSAYFGMERGFDRFVEEGAMKAVVNGETVAGGTAGANAARTFDRAIAWLERRAESPFVLFVHTYEPHTPYKRRRFAKELPAGRLGDSLEVADLRPIRDDKLALTDEELDYVRALYDGGIASADRHVGRLLAALDEHGLTEETLVVVTSDHGEELGEHFPRFVADHGHSLRDDQLLVPLVLADPTLADPPAVVPWQVRLIDVLPTVADRLGVSTGEATAGRSLVPLLRGDERLHRPAVSGHTKSGPPRRSLRDGVHKLIVVEDGDAAPGAELVPPVPDRQLYDLTDDPGERRNRHGDDAALAARMEQLLRAWKDNVGTGSADLRPDADDEEVRQQLRELGYVR